MINIKGILATSLLTITAISCAPHRPASPTEEELEVQDPTTEPAEVRRGVAIGTTNPVIRQRFALQRLARAIEPEMQGQTERLPRYIDLFKRLTISDKRMFAFDAQAEAGEHGALILNGFAELAEHRESLEKVLQKLGFEHIDNRIELLPSKSLGDQTCALITTASTFLLDRPAPPRQEKISQAVLAEPLYLLKETPDGHFLCHGGDGYVGYVAATDIVRVTPKQMHEYLAGPRAYVTQDCRIDGRLVPAGCRLKVLSTSPMAVTVQEPSGKKLSLPPHNIGLEEDKTNPQINLILETAGKLINTPYVWSGKTSEGVDCSGLVQSSFKAHGFNLPRDADQQALCGNLVATRWDRAGLARGDLLFFVNSRGTIHHVAVYLGKNQYLQASGKTVKISSFDPAAPTYEKEREASFCFAKRIIE